MQGRHVVDFRIADFLGRDLAQLPQDFFFFFGHGHAVFDVGGQVGDLHQTRAALAVLAIEGNGNLVFLGQGKDGAAITGYGVNGDVFGHDWR